VFAGRDASRGLATFSLTEDVLKDEYDDLSDLTSMQMESVREWEMQFTGNTYCKYKLITGTSVISKENTPL
jgi:membrane-associated progesterone receptor component